MSNEATTAATPPETIWIDPIAPRQMYWVEHYEPLAEHLIAYVPKSTHDAQMSEVVACIEALLNDVPQPNGEYFHSVLCSGSRHKPIGVSGCACKNYPLFKRFRAEVERLREALRGVSARMLESDLCWCDMPNLEMGEHTARLRYRERRDEGEIDE